MYSNNRLNENIVKYNDMVQKVRVIAVFLVILSHSYPLTNGTKDILVRVTKGQMSWGNLAVQIFFFISGIYALKKLEKVKSPIKFLWDKLKRLIPALLIVVCFTVFLLGPLVTTENISSYFSDKNTYRYFMNCIFVPMHNLPGVFVNNPYANVVNGSLWTLPLEIVCCVGIALLYLIKVFNNKKKLVISSVFLLIAWIAMSYLVSEWIPHYNIHLNLCLMFYLGALLWSYRKYIPLNICIFIVSCIGVSTMSYFGYARVGVLVFLPYIICYTCFSFQVTTLNILLKRIENSTYEMYLLAFPIQQIIVHAERVWGGGIMMQPLANTVIACAATIPAAVCLNWFIDNTINLRLNRGKGMTKK